MSEAQNGTNASGAPTGTDAEAKPHGVLGKVRRLAGDLLHRGGNAVPPAEAELGSLAASVESDVAAGETTVSKVRATAKEISSDV